MNNHERFCQVRVTICDAEGRLFGKGPYELLCAIQQHASVRQACQALGLSYTKAWRIIRRLEQGFGQPLILRYSGGKHGGGAGLTPFAQELLDRYQQLEASVAGYAKEEYRKVFGEGDAETGNRSFS